VTASQVAGLRQEVTAVLRKADVARGDEVVLVLNTGGGTVTGYGLAAAQLTRLKKFGVKLTVCVEQVAASGGYMMACVADELLCAPFAVIGSIGVITEQPNVYERLSKEGVSFSTVTAGKFKRTLTPTKKLDAADLAKLKEDIEQILVLFQGFVKEQRPTLDIEKVATGETWLGPDALSNGLVDGLTTVDEVLNTHVDEGREVYSIKYEDGPKSPLAALGVGASAGLSGLGLGDARDAANLLRTAAALQQAGSLARSLTGGRGGVSGLGGLGGVLGRSSAGLYGGLLRDTTSQPMASRLPGEVEPEVRWEGAAAGADEEPTWFM